MKPHFGPRGLFLVAAGCLAGCHIKLVSDEAAKALSAKLETGLASISQQIALTRDVCFVVDAFLRRESRWPKTYAELRQFVTDSNGFLQLRPFDDISFVVREDEDLDVAIVNDGVTHRVRMRKPSFRE